MKRIFVYLIPLLFVSSCAKEIQETMIPEDPVSEKTSTEVPGEIVIKARLENPETKTYLQMNESGTYANVLWKAGDKIKLAFIGTDSRLHTYISPFTTEDDGTSNASFSCFSDDFGGSGVRYYAFYPSSAFLGYSNNNGTIHLGVSLPSVQQAVDGNIANGLNYSFSVADALTDEFVFKNIPSLLKFRLKGKGLNSLSKITFVANTLITGDRVYKVSDEGDLVYLSNYSLYNPIEEPGYVVTLNAPEGGFKMNTDYYIAVYPGTTEGFSIRYYANDGDYAVKYSTKTLELKRSQITDFGTLTIDDYFMDEFVTHYKKRKTTDKKPVDIVVLSEGFTSGQRAFFDSLATEGVEYLLKTEPYAQFKDYFNVYFIWAASNQAGASVTDGKGNILTQIDNAFESRWGPGYRDMDANDDLIYDYVSTHCPDIADGTLKISEVPIILLINDSRYGGIAHVTSTGRSFCMVPYMYSGRATNWSFPSTIADVNTPGSSTRATNDDERAEVASPFRGDWRNVLIHEYGGHSFARLTDEYWNSGSSDVEQSVIVSQSWPVPFALNISGFYDTVPWDELLDIKDSLISINQKYDRIGKYQGAYYSITNRWRSEMVSCLIDNRPYYSTWQRVLIAKRITELAGDTFNFASYMANDVMFDPVRDQDDSSLNLSKGVNTQGPITIMPPTAPPVLIDDTPEITRIRLDLD